MGEPLEIAERLTELVKLATFDGPCTCKSDRCGRRDRDAAKKELARWHLDLVSALAAAGALRSLERVKPLHTCTKEAEMCVACETRFAIAALCELEPGGSE